MRYYKYPVDFERFIDRNSELRDMADYIQNKGIVKVQTAFVAVTQQAVVPPDREFVHSNVVKKYKWPRGLKKGYITLRSSS